MLQMMPLAQMVKVIFVTGSDPNEYMGLIDTDLSKTAPYWPQVFFNH